MGKKSAELKSRLGKNMAESIADKRLKPSANGNGKPDAPRINPGEIDLSGVERGAGGALLIPVARIDADPFQPRKTFDDATIAQLAASLKYGMLQPILVRPDLDRFSIVDGERRFRAAVSLGWEKVPAVLHFKNDEAKQPTLLDADRIGLWIRQFLANRQREDLNPIEEARAIKSLLGQTGWNQREAAANLGISQGSVSKSLALLELDAPRIKAIESGKLSPSAALESRGLEIADALPLEEGFAEAMKRSAIREAKRALTVAHAPSPPPPDARTGAETVIFKPNPSLAPDPKPKPLEGQGAFPALAADLKAADPLDDKDSEFYFSTNIGTTRMFALRVEARDGAPLENREIIRVLRDAVDFIHLEIANGEKRPGKNHRRKA
jgi:ParB family transcriptional regulator, chromosome partitioning protein